MQVPDHIYLGSGPQAKPPQACPPMVVPRKITVGVGETHQGHKGPPVEVLAANKALETPLTIDTSAINGLPQTLTADEFRANDDNTSGVNDMIMPAPNGNISTDYNMSNLSSLAVDEDPLRELKNTRRQLKRLTARVMDLERTDAKRESFIGWLKTGLIGNTLALVAVVSFIAVQQIKRR